MDFGFGFFILSLSLPLSVSFSSESQSQDVARTTHHGPSCTLVGFPRRTHGHGTEGGIGGPSATPGALHYHSHYNYPTNPHSVTLPRCPCPCPWPLHGPHRGGARALPSELFLCGWWIGTLLLPLIILILVDFYVRECVLCVLLLEQFFVGVGSARGSIFVPLW